jgi:putative ABC transport system ATP-binding protein
LDPLVKVQDLSFAHERGANGQQVLSSLTMHLDPGELVVLTGPSGSGKSTLLTIIGGLRSTQEGSVEVLGMQVVGAAQRQLIQLRRGIGFIFQQHNLAPALTVSQNIQMGLQLGGGHRGSDARERIERTAARVGLTEHLNKLPGRMSGGQQQRAGIARALVNEPSLVLADEPTASLDRDSGQMVMDLFNELAAGGSAVVLVTHDKRVIDQADRILTLEDGRLVPNAEAFMKDTSSSLQKLMQIDAGRLGRLMSFGHALAQVALADGTVDELERAAMVDALRARKIFSGSELELVVDLALAQARASEDSAQQQSDRDALKKAAEAVAGADSVVTDEERAVIAQILAREPGDA